MRLLVNVLVSGLAVFVAARILPGVSVDRFSTAVIVAVVLGLVVALLGPALLILTLPINVMTLGLFTFFIIGFLVLVVDRLVPGFRVANIWWAMAFSLVLSVVNAFLHGLAPR